MSAAARWSSSQNSSLGISVRDVTVNWRKSSKPATYATPNPSGTTSPQPYGPKFLV